MAGAAERLYRKVTETDPARLNTSVAVTGSLTPIRALLPPAPRDGRCGNSDAPAPRLRLGRAALHALHRPRAGDRLGQAATRRDAPSRAGRPIARVHPASLSEPFCCAAGPAPGRTASQER